MRAGQKTNRERLLSCINIITRIINAMGPIIIPRPLPNKANTKLRAVTKASIPREAILRIFILKLEAFP